jgi:DNA-binding MarR family transcriptional regulator
MGVEDEPTAPREFSLATSPSHLLHRAQQVAAERFSASLQDESELTLRQFVVLAALRERDATTQTDLVRATGIDRSTLADMIARLEKRNLVARENSMKDKRAKLVKLTQRGAVLSVSAAPHALAADAALMEALPKPKRRALLEILQSLAEAADAAAEEALAAAKAEKKKKKDKERRAKKMDKDERKARGKKKKKNAER